MFDPLTAAFASVQAGILTATLGGIATQPYIKWSSKRLDRKLTAQVKAPPPEPKPVQGTAQYAWRSLPTTHHIRVFDLLPGEASSPLCCRIREVEVTDRDQSYTALSYRWSKSRRMIFCEGRHIHIPQNLFDLLLQLRSPSEALVLWADAICINQGDVAEKSFQIPLMGQIYGQCDECKIWLGRHGAGDALAFRLLDTLQKAVQRVDSDGRLCRYRLPGNVQAFLANSRFRSSDLKVLRPESTPYSQFLTTQSQWAGLSLLLQSEWHERIWTLQEIILPRKAFFLFGQYQIPAEHFYQVISLLCSSLATPLHAYIDESERVLSLAKEVSEMRYMTQVRTDLLKTLRTARRRLATDSRDKIFGIAGLYTGSELLDHGLNYGMSTSDLYIRIALLILDRHEEPLQLLSACERRKTQSDLSKSLPSWVPDWDDHQGFTTQTSRFESTQSFHAGKIDNQSKPFLQIIPPDASDARLRLRLRGKLVTRIASTRSTSTMDKHEQPRSGRVMIEKIKKASRSRKELKSLGIFLTDSYSALFDPDRVGVGRLLKPYPSTAQILAKEILLYISARTIGATSVEQAQDLARRGQAEMKALNITTFTGHSWAAGDLRGLISHLLTLRLQDTISVDNLRWATWKLLTCEAQDGPRDFRKGSFVQEQIISALIADHECLPVAQDFLHDLEAWAQERQLCIAIDGRAGWVPYSAEVDDWVCVVEGHNLPFVLRQSMDEDTFTMIGTCYLEDVMHGEVLQRSDLPWREIELI